MPCYPMLVPLFVISSTGIYCSLFISLHTSGNNPIIMASMKTTLFAKPSEKFIFTVLLILSASILIGWLWFTPPGVLGKAQAIGYAVCHQIPERSFQFAGISMPLCSRCTGMHLGALFGLLYHFWHFKKGGMPGRKVMLFLGAALLFFALDGINSFISLTPFIDPLYTPQNWLRLSSGTLLGFSISAILVPIFNQTIWADWFAEPSIKTWKQVLLIVVGSALIIFLVATENPLILYPLSLLSVLNLLIILTAIHTILWVLLLKKENLFLNFSQLKTYMLCGFITVIVQIALMDFIRYQLTGTWNSFY